MGNYKKVKGFIVMPSTLASRDTGDVDDWTFYAGDTLEEALSGHFQKIFMFKCMKCGNLHDDEVEAAACCED